MKLIFKSHIIFAVCFFSVITVNFAQPVIYKNELLNPQNMLGDIGWEILKVNNDKYIAVTNGFKQTELKEGISFFILNGNLEITNRKDYYYSNKRLIFGGVEFNNDSTSIILKAGVWRSNIFTACFFKFNLECDSLYYKEIPDTIYRWKIIHEYQNSAGDYYFSGSRSMYSLASNHPNTLDEYPCVVKTDSLGNEIWRKIYTVTNRGWARSIQKTLDGNFLLILNVSESIPDAGLLGFHPALMKIDTAGNMLWYKRYGEGVLNNNGRIAQVHELPDSTLIFETNFYRYPFDWLIAQNNNKYPVIIHTNKNGEIIEIKNFMNSFEDYAIGEFKYIKDYFYSCGEKGTSGENVIHGYFRKYDLYGNFIQENEYNFLNNGTSLNSLSDFEQCSDSGFVFIGGVIEITDEFIGPARAWLVKTDKYGCVVADCQLTDVIEPKINDDKILVYPNPANEVLNVTNTHEIAGYQIFEHSGKLLTQGNTFPIPISPLANGLYFLQIQTKSNQIINHKFLKR